MPKKLTESKPQDVEQPSDEGLDETTCCASLNAEQRDILHHTIHRAAGGRYCGGGKDMDRLVELGFMEYLGTPRWCPDPFYGITRAGREAFRRHNAQS